MKGTDVGEDIIVIHDLFYSQDTNLDESQKQSNWKVNYYEGIPLL